MSIKWWMDKDAVYRYTIEYCMCVKSLHIWLFVSPGSVAHQVPLSMEFSRQQSWSGLPFPFPGVFLTQELNPRLLCLLHCRQTLYPLSHQENPYIYILEKATHSSTLAWRIPWKEEPGRLQSMGPQRVGYDWMTNTFTFLSLWSHSCHSLPSFPFPICQNLTHLQRVCFVSTLHQLHIYGLPRWN